MKPGAPIRHALARIDERAAESRVAEHSSVPAAGLRRGLLWVPFSLGRGSPALPRDHRLSGLALPSAASLHEGPPPLTDRDEALPAEPGPHVYLPFWRFRDEGGEVMVCGLDGKVVLSRGLGRRRAEIQRAFAVLALAFFFGCELAFSAEEFGVLSGVVMRPSGPLVEAGARLLALALGVAFVFWVVEQVVRPALSEAAREIAVGQPEPGVGPAVARFSRWVGAMALLVASYQVLLVVIQPGFHGLPVLLSAAAGVPCALAARRLGRTPAPAAPRGGPHHAWAPVFRTFARVFEYAIGALLLNTILFRMGIYGLAQLGGVIIEANQGEAILVTLAVLRAVATSELAPRESWPLVTGLAVPTFVSPFLGPGPATVIQFLAVLWVTRLAERRFATAEPVRQSLVQALEIEIALVAGSLAGSLAGVLLVGSAGSTLGDVVGSLIAATLVLRPVTPRRSAPSRGARMPRPAAQPAR